MPLQEVSTGGFLLGHGLSQHPTSSYNPLGSQHVQEQALQGIHVDVGHGSIRAMAGPTRAKRASPYVKELYDHDVCTPSVRTPFLGEEVASQAKYHRCPLQNGLPRRLRHSIVTGNLTATQLSCYVPALQGRAAIMANQTKPWPASRTAKPPSDANGPSASSPCLVPMQTRHKVQLEAYADDLHPAQLNKCH